MCNGPRTQCENGKKKEIFEWIKPQPNHDICTLRKLRQASNILPMQCYNEASAPAVIFALNQQTASWIHEMKEIKTSSVTLVGSCSFLLVNSLLLFSCIAWLTSRPAEANEPTPRHSYMSSECLCALCSCSDIWLEKKKIIMQPTQHSVLGSHAG